MRKDVARAPARRNLLRSRVPTPRREGMESPAGEEGLDEATYFDMEREKALRSAKRKAEAAKAASATKAK